MDAGETETEDWPSLFAGVSLVDSPILFLVVSHKAFRAELTLLRRATVQACENRVYSNELFVDLSRRLEFFKLVFDYHSLAEDEVIFLALDAQVKNVAPSYSLEHKSIEDNFSFLFHHLDILVNRDGDAHEIFQELVFSIGAIQAMICQHMQKEEEQVFPLLKQKFTCEEQSQFVWQYISSVPVILLEEFLPWMTSSLSSDERLDVLQCLKLIIPKDRLLEEVVVSWIQHMDIASSDTYSLYRKGYHVLKGISSSEDVFMLYPHHTHQQEEEHKSGPLCINDDAGPIEGIHIWHAALRREFDEIMDELYQIRNSNCLTNFSSAIVQLKFILDVLIFYSNSLDKMFYPLLIQVSKNELPTCSRLIDQNAIKGLQLLLPFQCEGSAQLRSFVENFYEELEALVREFSKNLLLLETEVFPLIRKKCTREMQLWLFYTSLRGLPLGLLRSTVTWFSAHLSEKHSSSLLKNMKVGCLSTNKSFTSLLYEWVRTGCSGKTSIEKFRQNLKDMFHGRSFYLSKILFSDDLPKPNIAVEMKQSVSIPSSSVSIKNEKNVDEFFSEMLKRLPPLHRNVAESKCPVLDTRPMDHILYFHRALIKDLEYLVFLSAKLSTNIEFLSEFRKRFYILRVIYQFHSKAEDEIAFPALESKAVIQNVCHSYCIDHKLEVIQFKRTSRILVEFSEFHDKGSYGTGPKYHQLCLKLHETCLSMHTILSDHIRREEAEIFPLFKKFFSIEEEENIVGHMLGRTRAEILQEMIPWLMGYLTSDEQNIVMSLWFKVSKFTNFNDWLEDWWDGMSTYKTSKSDEPSKSPPVRVVDPTEVISAYLQKGSIKTQKDGNESETKEEIGNGETFVGGEGEFQSQEAYQYPTDAGKTKFNGRNERWHNGEKDLEKKVIHEEHHMCMNQEELEAIIRRVSRDSSLDSQKKTFIIQNLLTSRWMETQKKSQKETTLANDNEKIPGQYPSFREQLTSTFGCKHYKRNCKLLTPCCNELHTCIRCHDDLTNHVVDRKTITKMMCMKCLEIQPIGPNCTNAYCGSFSMARYYCQTCKLFEDERQIYHCPYCNLCRVGKGLGMDYFHCMKCNACMSKSLFVHVCREKCLEDNCPICHEYIFTSSSPVKALPCGHLMHSACFQDYICSHYICPICSKSLGDMQMYFEMLDALLAEEKMPEEYSGQIQVILCNDCAKRGTASFHWLYHKCPHCGSYNTRLL